MNQFIADIRRDYKLRSLEETDMAVNPFDQFTRWWDEAVQSDIDEVNAMVLATATTEGVPSARIVLLKGYTEKGFIFFTNYNSHKGKELQNNPHTALVFFWKELERQVRIEGIAEKTSAEESDRYFQSRPAESRIGAWASPQSEIVPDREVIEKNFMGFQNQFRTEEIPRPPHWGGYMVRPTLFEFWQGRSNRLHDRMQYTPASGAHWKIERLAP